jgi:hypothetical protein
MKAKKLSWKRRILRRNPVLLVEVLEYPSILGSVRVVGWD